MNVKALFESVSEYPEPLSVPVKGIIPDWLRGTYYTVGNGLWDLPGGFTLNHALDGYAILYSFRISDSKQITVRSRFLESDSYKKALSKGRPVATEFGTIGSPDPEKGVFIRMLSQVLPINLTDNDFFNLVYLQGNLYAVSETCFIHQINLDNLKSMEKVDLFKTLGCAYISGIPLHLEDGTTYCLGHTIGAGLKSSVFQFPSTPCIKDNGNNVKSETFKKAKIVSTVSSRWKLCFSYMHSFAMTTNFFILADQPMLVNNLKVLTTQIQNRTIREVFDWRPNEKFLFILINRTTGKAIKTKYLASPIFIIHIINAYEDGGQIVLDVIGRLTDKIIDNQMLNKLRRNEFSDDDPPQVYRFVLPIVSNISDLPYNENLVMLQGMKATAEKIQNDSIFCTPVALGKPGFDFPVINKALVGKTYRFVYGTGCYADGFFKRAICKMDMNTEETILLRAGDNQYLCEPFFISRPNASDEDDGIVIATMIDTRPDHPSAIIFVDGQTFLEIGRAEIPYKLAFIQHGIFIKAE